MEKIKIQKLMPKLVIGLLTCMVLIFFLFPIGISILTSFKTPMEIAESVLALPKELNIQNYIDGIEKSNFTRSLLNSIIVTVPGVIMITLFSAMGGYSIARYSKQSKIIAFMDKLYLSSLMIPFQVIMIPVYRMFKNLGMMNSLGGMILMLTGISIAYSTFLTVGFVKSIPKELEEAALIDGCGPYRSFFLVVFPMMKPIVSTVAALHVMWLWNDFNVAVILLQNDMVRTLTVKQYYFFGEYFSRYGVAFAIAILCMLPIMIFFISMQKYLVEGITAGAVKS